MQTKQKIRILKFINRAMIRFMIAFLLILLLTALIKLCDPQDCYPRCGLNMLAINQVTVQALGATAFATIGAAIIERVRDSRNKKNV